MVDELGTAYIIEHIVNNELERKQARAYQAYMAECLRLSCENVAAQIPNGKYIAVKWYDLCDNKAEEEDNRTGDEIAADVIKRMGLSFGGDSV